MLILTVNGICLFWQLNDIGGGGENTLPLRSRKLQKVWLWNFHHLLVPIWRHKIKKTSTYLAWPVNHRPKSRKSRFFEMQLLDMLTLRNFAALSILTLEINLENCFINRIAQEHMNTIFFLKKLLQRILQKYEWISHNKYL